MLVYASSMILCSFSFLFFPSWASSAPPFKELVASCGVLTNLPPLQSRLRLPNPILLIQP